MAHRKTEGLKISAKKKKEQALQRTKEAIDNLIENKQKITISSVAKLARVSTSYIYKYPELAYQIQTLREQQKYQVQDLLLPPNKYNQLIDNLKQEKAELTKEINILNSSIESIISSDSSVKQLQANNVKLTLENQKLKQHLAKLEQEVYKLREVILDRGYVEDCDRQNEINLKHKELQKNNQEENKTSEVLLE